MAKIGRDDENVGGVGEVGCENGTEFSLGGRVGVADEDGY